MIPPFHYSIPLLAVLTSLVGCLWKMSAHPRFGKIFRFLPLPFWCYMLPMLGTTLGWLPAASPLYSFLSRQLLPVCLVLLLIGTDLKALARLGPLATVLMAVGALGTMLGGLISFKIYQCWLPAGSWAGIGALSASWIGGSANLLAVKEALQVPDSLMGPLILVDAVVAYSWMALLIWLSAFQNRWAFLIKTSGPATSGPLRRPSSSSPAGAAAEASPPASPEVFSQLASAGRSHIEKRVIGILLSIFLSFTAQWAAAHLPAVGRIMNPASWTILLVTTIALALSLTPLRQLEQHGVSRIGTFALFLLLASIGARADFRAILETPVFLALGLTWISIHGIVLAAGGYLLKAPLGLISTASQANIGGPISAPIVGATYHTELAGIGLLMAILGNILGTYLGLTTALAARFLSKA